MFQLLKGATFLRCCKKNSLFKDLPWRLKRIISFYRNVHGAVFKIVGIINDISFLIECLKKKEILFLKNDKKNWLILNLNINEYIAYVSVKKSKMHR